MISDFPTKKNYNPGGYLSFQFIPSQFVSDFPLVVGGQVTTPVIFYAGFTWLNGYATTETLRYGEDHQNDDAGKLYTLTVSGFVPGDKPELVTLMDLMGDNRYILLIRDTARQLRIAGSLDRPLDFISTFDSGELRSDPKGFRFTFSGQSLSRSPLYAV